MITVSALNEVSRVRHGFFTRDGGVSQGIYATLNCGLGSNDSPDSVRENRIRAMQMIDQPPGALVTLYQAHTADVVVVDQPWEGQGPQADAMVTTRPGIALGILTADCAPVLLADGKAGVIGAAHAGWKGALAGVLENTVAAMTRLGARPAEMVAAVGPCIAQRSYEVGPDFPAPFLAQSDDNEQFFAPRAPRPGHFLFDLAAYAARRLALAGVAQIIRTPCDTCQEASRFYSYRRATLRGEPDYGRQLSAIVIER
jgi:YfiH family protein